MMRRRMAQMNARMNPGGMGAAIQSAPVPAPVVHPIPQPAGAVPHVAAVGKPGSNPHPNQNVLEAVKKVRMVCQDILTFFLKQIFLK